MDRLSPEQRSKNMAAIRSKDTKLELVVRKGLWSKNLPTILEGSVQR